MTSINDIDWKLILVLSCLIFSIVLLILQATLLGIKPYYKDGLNDLLTNWKKSPILDIIEINNTIDYKFNEYIRFENKNLYIKRMKSKFTFPYLMKRSKNIKINKHNCFKKSPIEIDFPYYEKCPINEINISPTECEIGKQSIKINEGKYICFSNNKTTEMMYNDFDEFFEKEKEKYQYISIDKDNVPDDFDFILTVKVLEIIKNSFALFFILFLFPYFKDIKKFKDKKYYKSEIVKDFPFTYFFLPVIFLIILYSLGVHWSKIINKILNEVFEKEKDNKKYFKQVNIIHGLEATNLSFCIIFFILIIGYIVTKIVLYYKSKKNLENKTINSEGNEIIIRNQNINNNNENQPTNNTRNNSNKSLLQLNSNQYYRNSENENNNINSLETNSMNNENNNNLNENNTTNEDIYIFKRIEEKILIIYIKVIIILGGIILIIYPVVLLSMNLVDNPFNESLFRDLKLNYKMSPIMEIEIGNITYETRNIKPSYFNNLVPYKLGEIKFKNGTNIDLTVWKGIQFYVTRMKKKYTYPKIQSFKDNSNKATKKCGVDSKNNPLYFPSNEPCPINFIEISNQGNLNKTFRTTIKKINNNTYLYYSNENTDGEILVDLKLSSSLNDPIGDENTYNSICYSIYSKSQCILDNDYIGNNQIYGFKEIDYTNNSRDIDSNETKNGIIKLFKRTYAGIDKIYTSNFGNYIFNIHSLVFGTHITSLIFYILFLILISLMLYFYYNPEKDRLTFYFSSSAFAVSFISLVLNSLTIDYVKKLQKYIFNNSNLDIKENYISKPTFIKYDYIILILSIIFLIVGLTFSIIAYIKNKTCFTYTFKNSIEKFFFRTEYIPQKIFILMIIFTIIILFPSLLFSHNLYNEGYIDTIIENWKKSPITHIDIIEETEEGEKIGNFMNKNLYIWQGKKFKFTRKPGKYYYNKILKNKNKKCGRDNANNIIYALENESCPINDIIINEVENIDGYIDQKINDNLHLHYRNDNKDGRILVDLKVSDIKGPCLNKKKDKDLCLFYLDKCNLSYSDYICDAYKTDNGYGFHTKEEINKMLFSEFKNDHHNYLSDYNDNYDKTSEIYLYNETYIGVKESYRENKNFGKIYSIKKFAKWKNIFLFFSMFIFVICLIIFIYSYQKGKNTILSFVCLLTSFLSFICFLFSLASIIFYSKFSNNILKCFENELTDYYNKFVWQEVLEIFNMVFYLVFSITSLIFFIKYFNECDFLLFKKIKSKIPNICKIIRLRRKTIIWQFIISNFIFSTIPFILSVLLLKYGDFNDGYIKDIKENWEKIPIKEINKNTDEQLNFGIFNGLKDDTYSDNTTTIYFKKFNNYSFNLTRYENKKYNYPYFINNKEQNSKKCGIDSEGNGIYFPDDEDCPINNITIINGNNCEGTKIHLSENINLCYSNTAINNKIIVDFKISTKKNNCVNANFDNDICQHFNKNYVECSNIHDKNCNEDDNVSDYFKIDTINLNTLFEDNNIFINEAVYDNTEVYLYYRTYKGINRTKVEDISRTKSLLKSLINIKNFGKGKNIYLVIIHSIFIILLCFNFYFFDEEEKRLEKYFYGFSLFMIICLIINIFLCSHILISKNLFKNNIFKYLGDVRYNNFKKEFNYEQFNKCILIFDIFLMSLIIFWAQYYYTHKLTHVPKRWGIIRIIKKIRHIIIFFNFVFTIIILILICILLIKGEYNNMYYKSLENNWKKSPIYSIEKTDSSEGYIFNKFHGTKNKGYGESVNEENIFKWKSKIQVKRKNNQEKKKKYTDFFKDGTKLCGYDSEGNEMKVPNKEDCPINGIEINNNSANYDKNITLNDSFIIFYTNNELKEKNEKRKILVDFKISFITPSINIDTDNAICTLINDKCNLDYKKLFYNLIDGDEKIFNKIDTITLKDLLNNNDININENSYDQNQKINLYSETYIGKNDSIKYIFGMRKFSRVKNIVLLFFTLLFFIFLFIYFEFFPYKYGIYGLAVFIFVNFLLFINLILSIVSVALYYNVSNNVLKKFNNSIKTEYESTKWHCKVNLALIFLYIIDLALGILNYKALFKFKIISKKKEFEKKYDVNYNEPRTYQPEIPISNNKNNEGNNKTELLKQKLIELKNIEKILLAEIEKIKKEQNSEEFEKIKNEKKYLEDEIEKLTRNIKQLKNEKKKINSKTEEYNNELSDFTTANETELNELEKELEKYKKQIDNKNTENNKIKSNYEEKIQQLKNEIEIETKNLYKLREERANIRK